MRSLLAPKLSRLVLQFSPSLHCNWCLISPSNLLSTTTSRKFIRTTAVTSILLKSANNQSDESNDKNKKKEGKRRGISYSDLIKEETKRKLPVIDVWSGITPKQLAKIVQREVDDVYEAIVACDFDDINSTDKVSAVAKRLGFRCNVIAKPATMKFSVSEILPPSIATVDKRKRQERRPPVVTIMGHVDHGKTTLLDALRESELVKQEHGGITQHIGAFVVSLGEKRPKSATPVADVAASTSDLVTFLDTPGHAAFSAMRERGANVTDIVVLVVAADDGVMEQTVESIKFARSANVPIIVAINKIDKVRDLQKDLELVKRGLLAHGIVCEDDGGETQSVHLSALKGSGLSNLKEAILAQAETLQLKSYVDGPVEGVVVESSVHSHRGKLATLLIQHGTLKKGDYLLAGDLSWAKVRSMFDEWGNVMRECKPGYPVQVIGWKEEELPIAGDNVWQLETERKVKEIIGANKTRLKQEQAEETAKQASLKAQEHYKEYKEQLLSRRAAGMRYGRMRQVGPRQKEIIQDVDEDKKVNVILKCDVNGSLEVMLDVLDSYNNDMSVAKLDVVHFGVGPVTENDVELATCFTNTIIYAFNVAALNPKINVLAKENDIKIKKFHVIYHLVNDLKDEISSKLPLLDEEVVIGEATVLQEFVINEKNKKIPVAGSRCTKGMLKKHDCFYKVKRNEQIIANQLKIASLRHMKDEVKTIGKDVECGVRFEGIVSTVDLKFEPGDTLICYEIKKVKQFTKWSPPGF